MGPAALRAQMKPSRKRADVGIRPYGCKADLSLRACAPTGAVVDGGQVEEGAGAAQGRVAK